ncbi:flagellar basal body-associated FliL family protein [Ornithinibacillus californiensis]|uniref:DUF6583 family protein n=1 Tax=Ornithinibacillus californiensis TaxID=161536 RepID=UPI00064D7795|nr:DUF6583 family protein [Ornithinibacillus californiensis]
MEENNQEVRLKKKGSNKLIAIIIAAVVLLVGGSVAAFVLTETNSPKASYFIYEKKTLDMLTEQLEERYAPELEWSEKGLENPIEDVYELSAELNMPISGATGPITPEQIINNSTITITSNLDREEKIATAGLKGSFGNFTIEDINFYLTSEEMMLGLPFVNEILQLKGDDFGKLLSQLDPMTFTGEEKLDLNMLFEGNVIAEEDAKYIEDEYVKGLYEALPEEAFESVDETVKIGSDNVDTEKVTFHLTEEQVKEILKDTLTKMADDKRLKEIMIEYLQAQGTGPLVLGENANLEIPNFEEDYDTAIQEAINGLDDVMIPEGFKSTIWVADDIIVKRDLSIQMGPTEDQLVTLYVTGQLSKDKTDIAFEYDLGVVENDLDQSVSFDGTLSNNDGDIQDKLTISIEDIQVIYESNETLDDSKKDFKRTFTLIDETGYTFDLIWSGNAEYNGDQMNSSHELTVSSDDIMDDLVVLYIDKESKVTDSVTLPSDDELKDIGSMSLEELMTYFETEVTPQFEEWLMGIIGFGF